MDYVPSIIIVLSLLTVIVVIVSRGKTALWRWLFATEVLVLYECFGNCFLPGSSKQFWQVEIPAALVAGALAITSSILRRRKERIEGSSSTLLIWTMPQMLAFYAVLVIVAAMIAAHV